MIAQELSVAKTALELNSATLAVVNNGTTELYYDRGIKPLFNLANQLPNKLCGAFVADKVTGAASAYLLAYARVRALYTSVISLEAIKILNSFGIPFEAAATTEHIINRSGDGFCPMETAVKGCSSPSEALDAIKARLAAF